jgi:hypothetical protein
MQAKQSKNINQASKTKQKYKPSKQNKTKKIQKQKQTNKQTHTKQSHKSYISLTNIKYCKFYDRMNGHRPDYDPDTDLALSCVSTGNTN